MKRHILRKPILLLSFSVFPITVVYLAPAPPIMSLKDGVINLSVVVLVSIFISGFSSGVPFAAGFVQEQDVN